VEYFLRANAYSLVASLDVPLKSLADNGPGSFTGPFVSGGQAVAVLAAYATGLLLLAGLLFRQRDVE
jgi:hypothetical protein